MVFQRAERRVASKNSWSNVHAVFSLLPLCMTFLGLMDRNAKDGKNTKAHGIKNADADITIDFID
jgi:hypothetical protein